MTPVTMHTRQGNEDDADPIVACLNHLRIDKSAFQDLSHQEENLVWGGELVNRSKKSGKESRETINTNEKKRNSSATQCTKGFSPKHMMRKRDETEASTTTVICSITEITLVKISSR